MGRMAVGWQFMLPQIYLKVNGCQVNGQTGAPPTVVYQLRHSSPFTFRSVLGVSSGKSDTTLVSKISA